MRWGRTTEEHPGGDGHRCVAVTTRYGSFDADEGLAELVVMLHGEGIETLFSCEGDDVHLSPSWWRRAVVAWRARRTDAPGRHLELVLAPLEGLEGSGDELHGYLMFPGAGARAFYALVLDALSASTDPRAELVRNRLRYSVHDAPDRDCVEGLDVASLCEFVTGRWYFDVVKGFPDPFEARTTVRFPRRDVELVTAAVRDLLASRAAA